MAICRLVRSPKVVTITMTVASVSGYGPIVGFSQEVEKAWDSLKKRHAIRQRNRVEILRSSSSDLLEEEGTEQEERTRRNSTDVGKVMLKFRRLEEDEKQAKKDDVYSKDYTPRKYTKNSEEYGRPKPGTLTEKRALKASKHVAKEMLYLCEVIMDNGFRSKDGKTKITFGKLFQIYQHISDKVVGILLRCRKHGMVEFPGEMLYQRRDEDVIITLNLNDEDIKAGYAQI